MNVIDLAASTIFRKVRLLAGVHVRALAACFVVGGTLLLAVPHAEAAGRVYEKVSPADKNGSDIMPGQLIDGDTVSLRSTLSFLEQDPFADGGRYLASRSVSGWVLRPAAVATKTFIADVNRGVTQQIIESHESCEPWGGCAALLAEDTDGQRDVYARDAGGLRLISKGSVGGNASRHAVYVGQSDDGSSIFFETTERLEPGDDPTGDDTVQLYESVNGETRPVGILPDGTTAPVGGVGLGDGFPKSFGSGLPDLGRDAGSVNPISADGDVTFFESPNPVVSEDHQLYARIDGQTTVHVSASKCFPECGPVRPATFQGASKDGNRVYFTTAGRLLDADGDDNADLYQYRLDTGALTLITQACEAADGSAADCGWSTEAIDGGMSALSNDGRRAYFVAPPTPMGDYGTEPSGSLWLYDEAVGTTRFIAPVDPAMAGPMTSERLTLPALAARATPDGGTYIFMSSLKLTAHENLEDCSEGVFGERSPCQELYRYQVQTGSIDCISCNPQGKSAIGQIPSPSVTLFPAAITLSNIAGGRRPNPLMSDDGRTIAFNTADSLTGKDVNGVQDVYEWHNGEVSILSKGTASGPAEVMGVAPDGRDIFFTTYDRLTASDHDFQADLYDARIGGSEEPLDPTRPCEGDGCQGPQPPPPTYLPPATATHVGPGNVRTSPKPKKKPVKCKRGYKHKHFKGKIRCVKRPIKDRIGAGKPRR
jgi:hypothetical protein